MARTAARLAFAAVSFLPAAAQDAETFRWSPLAALPPALATLGLTQAPEAFAVAGDAVVYAAPSAGDALRSTLTIERADAARRDIPLDGRVTALAMNARGAGAWAIVRVHDRKGVVRRTMLVAIDPASGRTVTGPTLPSSARGVAIDAAGESVVVASANELRSFRAADLTSGPLYRVPGELVGAAPVEGAPTLWLVAQPGRIGLVDLAAPQGRDGLPLIAQETAPAALRAVVASSGEPWPRLVAEDGRSFRVEVTPPSPPPPPPPKPEPVADAPPPPPAVAQPPPDPEPERVVEPDPAPAALESGSISGLLDGSARAQVTAVIALGPDNILKEAARATPAGDGGFRFENLAPGAYRIVAVGQGGRVLICDPPYVSVRLDGSRGAEAPVLRVLRAP